MLSAIKPAVWVALGPLDDLRWSGRSDVVVCAARGDSAPQGAGPGSRRTAGDGECATGDAAARPTVVAFAYRVSSGDTRTNRCV